MSYSPYEPPRDAPVGTFRPLGAKTTATAIAIVGSSGLAIVVTIMGAVKPLSTDPNQLDLTWVGIMGVLGIVLQLASLAAGILFLFWIHQAATNLRGYGHEGFEFSPGWCVAWWFIPIASLWKPYQATKEVWLASDPNAIGAASPLAWRNSTVPAVFPLWWATYITSGFVALIGVGWSTVASMQNVEAPGANVVAFFGQALSAASAVAIVWIMRKLDTRQSECAMKLRG
jgi:hypothetical protein